MHQYCENFDFLHCPTSKRAKRTSLKYVHRHISYFAMCASHGNMFFQNIESKILCNRHSMNKIASKMFISNARELKPNLFLPL